MNITLSAPDQTVLDIRRWAEESKTTLNQYIRDCLEAKAAELRAARARKAEELVAFLRAHPVSMPKGWKFDREEANARR